MASRVADRRIIARPPLDHGINFIGPWDLWNTEYLRIIDDSQYIDERYGSAQAAANPPVNVAI